jgi:hypothetical protein
VTLRLPVVVTVLVVCAVLAYLAAGEVGAHRKLARLEPLATKGNYEITLAFAPERFHQLLLQDKGRLVGVKGSTVFMKDVDAHALASIARNYWVESITRWSGQ